MLLPLSCCQTCSRGRSQPALFVCIFLAFIALCCTSPLRPPPAQPSPPTPPLGWLLQDAASDMGEAIKNDAATARDKAVDAGASARDTAEAKRDEAAVRLLGVCIVACFAGKGTSAAVLFVGCLLLHGPQPQGQAPRPGSLAGAGWVRTPARTVHPAAPAPRCLSIPCVVTHRRPTLLTTCRASWARPRTALAAPSRT